MQTYVFRPLPGDNKGWQRFNDGNWIPDDGKPDMAFARAGVALFVHLPHLDNILWSWRDLDEDHRYQWHYALINPALKDTGEAIESSWFPCATLPNTIAASAAMNKACELSGGAANGRGPSTYEPNEWIGAELLWTIDGDNIIPVKAPENPVCYLCLDDKRGHKIATLRQQHEHVQGEILQAVEEKNKAQYRADDIEYNEIPKAYKLLRKIEAQITDLNGEMPEKEEGLADILAEITKNNPELDGKPSRIDELLKELKAL